jgi:hypothetical protein
VKQITQYNLAAGGLGYDVIKRKNQILTLRAGLSFRYESYQSDQEDPMKSLGLDLGLHREYSFENSKVVNDLTIVPAFNNFSDYRITHESYYEVPLAKTRWKLRVGMSNDYTSLPTAKVEKLETTYFSRFVLSWE